jgi:hypothetical protein
MTAQTAFTLIIPQTKARFKMNQYPPREYRNEKEPSILKTSKDAIEEHFKTNKPG